MSRAPQSADLLAAELDRVLAEMVGEHEQLLALAAEHRAAIRAADTAALSDVIERQRAATDRIQGLDRVRRTLTEPAALLGDASLGAIADRASDPVRTRLRATATRLKELAAAVRTENAALKLATQSLLSHIDGLIAQVGRALSHTGTYSRRGAVAAGPQVVSGLDLTL